MVASTLGGETLGSVQQISQRKTGVVLPFPLPLNDSSEAEVFDLGSNLETFSVRGIFQTTTIAATKVLVDAIFALKTGNQKNKIDLVSDQTGTIGVKVMDIDITWDVADTPTSVVANYNVVLVRSK